MKAGVAATGGSMDAQVSDTFGRCRFFLIVDTETMTFEAFSNPSSGMGSGAGPAAVQELANRGAEVALAERFGPRAVDALQAAGIRAVEASGIVREAVSTLS